MCMGSPCSLASTGIFAWTSGRRTSLMCSAIHMWTRITWLVGSVLFLSLVQSSFHSGLDSNLSLQGNSILVRSAGWSSGRGISLLSCLQEWFYCTCHLCFTTSMWIWKASLLVVQLSHQSPWLPADIKVVTTPDGEVPNDKNSHPLYNQWDEGEERGSCVWFNQATMFQSSELDITTMKKAWEDGLEVDIDFPEMVRSNKYFRQC